MMKWLWSLKATTKTGKRSLILRALAAFFRVFFFFFSFLDSGFPFSGYWKFSSNDATVRFM